MTCSSYGIKHYFWTSRTFSSKLNSTNRGVVFICFRVWYQSNFFWNLWCTFSFYFRKNSYSLYERYYFIKKSVMSLQVCPNCLHTNRYWRIYWELNSKHFKYGMKIKCENCGGKMVLKHKSTLGDRIVGGFLWMSPALLLIYLVATHQLHFITAIILIVLYHFIAFYGIIKNYEYTSFEKK